MNRIKDDDGSYIVELELEQKGATSLATCYSDGDKDVWLPDSQILDSCKSSNGKDLWIVAIPEWLAIEKELV